MFAAIRKYDWVFKRCKGKVSGGFLTASTSTFVDGRGQVRVGDKCPPGTVLTGSRTTFIDGRPAALLNKSKVSCGRIKGPGSLTTFIGA